MWGSSLTRMQKKKPLFPLSFFSPPLSLLWPHPLLSSLPLHTHSSTPGSCSSLSSLSTMSTGRGGGDGDGGGGGRGCRGVWALACGSRIHSPPPLVRGAPSGGGGRGIWRSPHESAGGTLRSDCRDGGWQLRQHRGLAADLVTASTTGVGNGEGGNPLVHHHAKWNRFH